MIENERQYHITSRWLGKFKAAVKEYDLDEAEKRIGSGVLARAELNALKSEVEVLENQIRDYMGECGWETTEDGGEHVYMDQHRRARVLHAAGDCPSNCPLRNEEVL